MTNLSEVLAFYRKIPDWAEIDCNINTPNNYGDYIINVAATRCKVAEIEILLEAGADVNQRGEHGFSPVLNAFEQGCLLGVVYLLDKGANPNIANSDGTTPETLAALSGENEILHFLKNWKSTKLTPRKV